MMGLRMSLTARVVFWDERGFVMGELHCWALEGLEGTVLYGMSWIRYRGWMDILGFQSTSFWEAMGV
jgi:hypothetical protein